MNKRFYRIVFNKARGMLMVVAETTRSHRAGVSPQSGADARTGSMLTSTLAPLAFSFLLAFSCLTPAQAAIVADNHAPGGQQPQIANSANGTPQVNIQTPSGAGVSRNVYSQFDVDGRGVVLNNSRANTSTQLAGMVAGNPNLAKGEARVILNEVNTRDPSRLNGYIEVAGQKAQVVIANPAGISCDGCGFINANRATLTTGQVQYGNGQISGYDVNRGEILVQGGGLDASSVDSTDLLARAVKINAGVWAQELKVTAGRNQIDATHSRTTAKSADGSALPAVAIDVSALGGMYAHKIRLVGTERGVGVHNAGNIGAAAGDVAISADGALSNRGVIQSAQNLQLSVKGDLHNQGQLYAGKDSVVTASATLTNDGMIAAQGDTRIAANALCSAQNSTLAAGLNSDGSTASSGALTLNSQSALALNGRNMAAGTLTAQGRTVDLDNSRTSGARIVVSAATGDITTRDAVVVASEKLQLAASGKLNNHGGLLTASQLELKAMALDNQQGVIQQTGEVDLRLDFRAGLDNRGGEIASNSHALTLRTSQLLNQNGTLLHTGSGGISITSEGALDNGEGTIAANGNIVLYSDNINNRSGKISTTQGNAQLITRHELENSQGNIVAGGSLSLQMASLRNQQGQVIAAQGDLVMSAEGGLDNGEGVLAANGNIKLDADNLTNHGGKISAAQGDIQLTARHGVDNSQGNIIASGDIQLQAENLNNRHGQIGTAQRGSVNLTTSGLLDNQQGTITAFDALGIQSATVDNRQGELQSGGNLNITIHNRGLDNRQGQIVSAAALEIAGVNLALANTGGTLLAASELSLDADSLSGDGEVLSQGDMSLTLRQAFHNAGRVIANGNLQWNLSGLGLINQGIISAGQALNLYAAKLDNRQEGEISAGENHLTVSGELVNRGLIDGGLTHIVATTLTNIGSGRLYGDAVALQAATLTNAAENGVAATIAARASLAMGVGTLNNQDHALIYSDGTLAIGGQLAEDGSLSGRAGVFNNHSATLESAGDMALDIQQINNYNDHLVTKDVMVEQSWRHEAALKGSVQRFDWSLVDTSYKNKYGVHDAIMPDGSRGDEFYEYQYQRTVVETQVVESDPGKILSGGQLIINSDKLNNYDSQIIAGGALGGVIGELNNVATTGKRVTTDVGTQTRWYEKKTSRPFGGTKTSQGKKSSEYEPTPTVQTIDLQTMKWQGNTQIDGHSGVINPRDRADETGEIPAGRLVEVTPVNADGTVIRVVTPDTQLPVSSLYQIDPQAKAGYLVETDPRFTNGKAWLASDYMQNQLGVDQAMKRLGDGYYEQRLVREQIVKLSGGRYLQGYSNDEEQYRALMDAGVTFAKQYNLMVGVALTPAQMALLTSDMVWLVAREVTLTDGSVQQVLVPQVYARVKAGDLDGSGALLGGENVAFSVSRDVTNSGHIQSRGVTQLTAENIHNSGYIGGNQLTLNARTDINNIGGTLQGGDSLIAQAGRDINSASTLSGKNESHGSSFGVGINFGQGANGLTVSASANAGKGHEKGNSLTHNETTLSAGERVTIVSGRDTTLTGAQVSGHQVTMDVGRNLTLSSEQDSDNYDSKQRSGSVGASGSMGGGSGSLNLSQSKMHSTWASVEAQTGIFAGEGGFDVKVGGHTQLNGSVLASTAAAELNRLDTGTLGFRDIKNYAEYSVEQQSAGVSTSGSVAGQFLGNAASGLLMGANGSGSDSSLTRAAVSEGSIVIRDGANQQQDVTGLSRDAAHANQTLSPIFDKEKEQNRLATAQKTGEIGRQVSDVLVTQGKLNAQAAQSDPAARAAARAKLVAGGNGSPSEEQISAQVSRTATADYDTGGKYQKVAQAVTAAMQGLAGGDLAQAASGAVSPYVAEIIHSQTTDSATGKVNVEANAMAHAVWGAIAAASGNNSALAGAAGAVSGELLGRWIAAEYYPGVKTEELSDEQKSTISALSTLAAGLMGGLSGGSSADAVTGAQAGKNAVENNLLSGSEDAQAAWLRQHGIDMASCSDNPGGSACQKAINERNAVGLALASGSVALLPGGAQAMWGLGASANAGISYLADGTIDPANATIAGWVNVLSMGNGLAGTVGWNAAGGALGNWIDDKDPLSGALINGAGSGIGYGIGKGLSWGVNAGANWWKGGWDPKFNAELRQFTEIKGDFGISKEMTPSRVPGAFGDFGGSFFSEITGKGIEKRADSMGERKND
ncbi:TPA: hemagglutinin repeat-containing protein [Klebsiella variicola subsp. variicola]